MPVKRDTSPLQKIRDRIAESLKGCSRSPHSVCLIGVSKKQAIGKILGATEEDLWDFGENYVQEWALKSQQILQKQTLIAKKLHWHFIGHLQSNKVGDLVGQVEWIHSVDRFKLAKKISEIAEAKGIQQKILLQINFDNEANKSGFDPLSLLKEIPSLAGLPGLNIRGLMAIPPATPKAEQARRYFKQLKSLLDECNHSGVFKTPLVELSMGMSQDFEVAIEEGATMIRIGTAIFGPRI